MRMSLAVLLVVVIALAAGPAFAQTPLPPALDLQGDHVSLAMRMAADTPDHPQASSQVDLTTDLDHLQTRLRIGLQTGLQPPASAVQDAGWWDSSAAELGAVWTPLGAARFEIGAQNATRLQFAASDPVFGDVAQHWAQNRESTARAAATLTPAPPLALTVGARISTRQQQDDAVSGAGAQTSALVRNLDRQLFTELRWKPLAVLSLTVGGRVESSGVLWTAGRAESFAALNPSADLSLTPWYGADWRLAAEGVAAPLSTDQFIGYAQGAAALPDLQPNREWRYSATLSQQAGPVTLDASLLQARLRSVAYLAPEGALAERAGVGEGDRRELKAGLAAPLPLPGLAAFTLRASGTWRESMAQDPLTGAVGRLSGERPYDASLSLSQDLGGALRWGLSATAQGPQRTLGASQVTSVSAESGLGGFVQVRTRPLTLQLSLDNVLGGDRIQRDAYYTGTRGLGLADRADLLRTTDRGFRIALVRPL